MDGLRGKSSSIVTLRMGQLQAVRAIESAQHTLNGEWDGQRRGGPVEPGTIDCCRLIDWELSCIGLARWTSLLCGMWKKLEPQEHRS